MPEPLWSAHPQTAKQQRASIGIMVCEQRGTPPFPDYAMYRIMSQAAGRLGTELFVFCPLWVNETEGTVRGYRYDARERRWREGVYPLPPVVYDRCFARSLAERRRYNAAIRRLLKRKRARLLGSALGDKQSVHRLLLQEPAIAGALPETVPLRSAQKAAALLQKKRELFLKPQAGSQGKGALLAKAQENGTVLVAGRGRRNEPIKECFDSLSAFADWLEQFTLRRRYLIQPYLALAAKDGRPFDVRALVQKDGSGMWRLTGIAARVGKPGGVTSNLHGGGEALEAEPFLAEQLGPALANKALEAVRALAASVPLVLERSCGRLCELGLDFGITPDGRVWLLEANSKPGRSAFASISGGAAGHTAAVRPLQYAAYLLRNVIKTWEEPTS